MSSKSIKSMIDGINSALDEFDEKSGIAYAYRLIDESGECVYAGQTENLKRRIIQHLSDGKSFCDVSFTRCLSADANDAEALSIAKYKPHLNKNLPSNRFFVTHKNISELISKKLINERVILELPSGAGKFRYLSTESAEKILMAIDCAISECIHISEYDFDSSEKLVALGEGE